jgi:pimeloyl-ACP methyl ester carboxylesterase
LQNWQKPGSQLVKTLAADADVFAFAYSQNVAVDRIGGTPGLGDNIRRLKQLGYAEIVLVGHSAGGLVARQFVEDWPEAGVTKVIQVCTPNGGSFWGKAELSVRKPQEVFLASLTKTGRQRCLAERAGKKIPGHVEFVCLVGQLDLQVSAGASLELEDGTPVGRAAATVGARGDGVVSSGCQWTADLQEQGIPAVSLGADHFTVMRSKAATQEIAQLAREKQPRWNAAEVTTARKKIIGDEDRPR